MSLEKSKKLYGADLDVLTVAKAVDELSNDLEASSPIVLEMDQTGKIVIGTKTIGTLLSTKRPVYIYQKISGEPLMPVEKDIVTNGITKTVKLSWLSLYTTSKKATMWSVEFSAPATVTRTEVGSVTFA